MCHCSSRVQKGCLITNRSKGKSGTIAGKDNVTNSEEVDATATTNSTMHCNYNYLPTIEKDRLELVYPRKLFLGLWRVYSRLIAKMRPSKGSLKAPSSRPKNLEKNLKRISSPRKDHLFPSSTMPSSPSPHNSIPWGLDNEKSKCLQKFPPSDDDNLLSTSAFQKKISRSSSSWHRHGMILPVLFCFLLLLGSSESCGPGRGAGRRRAPRKLTPLVYKQHVPNVPENTLSASGLTEGRITRNHPRFKNLVPNYNQDIIFRDDEGSGADRLMTQRCKEKLNTLAISVMNQWPGVKLRVVEGWDEEALHAPHSLHYEGRAVDITTSDKARDKLGMLARLAVEAGFDWVYYESRSHIHCSVKSDSSQVGRTGGCFPSNSSVETPSGTKRISEILPGEKILSLSPEGKEVFSDVLLFLDKNGTESREFYELKTTSGTSITLTPSHLIYTIQPESLSSKGLVLDPNETGQFFLSKATISFTRNVQVGDWILVRRGQELFAPEKVAEMQVLVETGVYAPLTSQGNLIVDGVLSSCYAVIEDQDLDHWAFLPVRLSHNFMKGLSHAWTRVSRFLTFQHHDDKPMTNRKIKQDDQHQYQQGIHWYAKTLYSFSRFVLPNRIQYGV